MGIFLQSDHLLCYLAGKVSHLEKMNGWLIAGIVLTIIGFILLLWGIGYAIYIRNKQDADVYAKMNGIFNAIIIGTIGIIILSVGVLLILNNKGGGPGRKEIITVEEKISPRKSSVGRLRTRE